MPSLSASAKRQKAEEENLHAFERPEENEDFECTLRHKPAHISPQPSAGVDATAGVTESGGGGDMDVDFDDVSKNQKKTMKDGPHEAILLPTSAKDEFVVVLFDTDTGKYSTALTNNVINMVTKAQSVLRIQELYMNTLRQKIKLKDIIDQFENGINGRTYANLGVIHAVVHTKSMRVPQQEAVMKSKQGRMIYKVDIISASRTDESECLRNLHFFGEYYNPNTDLESYELTDAELMETLPSFTQADVDFIGNKKIAEKIKNVIIKRDPSGDVDAFDGVEITAKVAVQNFTSLYIESYTIKYGTISCTERSAKKIVSYYENFIRPAKFESERKHSFEGIAKMSGTAPGVDRIRLSMTDDLFSIAVVFRTAVAMTQVRDVYIARALCVDSPLE